MNIDKWKNQIRWGITAFLVMAAAAAVSFTIFRISVIVSWITKVAHVLKPVIYGMVLCYISSPIYNYVRSKTKEFLTGRINNKNLVLAISKCLATIISVVLIIVIFAGLLCMIIPELCESAQNLINSMPQNMQSFYNWLEGIFRNNPEAAEYINDLYSQSIQYFEQHVHPGILMDMQNIFSSISVGIISVIGVLKNFFIGLIIMMYLLNSKEEMMGQTRKLVTAFLPEKYSKALILECSYINEIFSGFFIAKIIDSAIIAAIAFVLFSIMKMPYALLVSAVIGITNIIPFFGPFIGAIPSFILILMVNPVKSIYFLIAILALQQFDGNILGPKILSSRTGMSSFWVLFSILLFGGILGFIGMIIAVPAWAVIMNAIERISKVKLRKKKCSIDSKDYQKKDELERNSV